jgi:hypothetical protein
MYLKKRILYTICLKQKNFVVLPKYYNYVHITTHMIFLNYMLCEIV